MLTQSNAAVRTLPEERLLELYASRHTTALEAELVERFMPLARSLAMRYRGGAEPTDDLLQVASLGLVKALRGYDPGRGHRFVAYAAPTILGELRRHFRDHSWKLHVPRRLQEGAMDVEKASAALTDDLGRSPSVDEIASALEISEEEVLDALQARQSQSMMSLDMPVRRDEAESIPRSETIGSEDSAYEDVEAQLAIEACVSLDERERAVLALRFEEGLNQYEIGRRLEISQMQVSRVLRRALAKLLEAAQGDERPDGKRTFSDDRPDPRFPHGRVRRRGTRAGDRRMAKLS